MNIISAQYLTRSGGTTTEAALLFHAPVENDIENGIIFEWSSKYHAHQGCFCTGRIAYKLKRWEAAVRLSSLTFTECDVQLMGWLQFA